MTRAASLLLRHWLAVPWSKHKTEHIDCTTSTAQHEPNSSFHPSSKGGVLCEATLAAPFTFRTNRFWVGSQTAHLMSRLRSGMALGSVEAQVSHPPGLGRLYHPNSRHSAAPGHSPVQGSRSALL